MRRRTFALLFVALALVALFFALRPRAPQPAPAESSALAPPPDHLDARPLVDSYVAAPPTAPDAIIAPPPPAPVATRSIVLHARWGDGPDEFGRRANPESNPEAPMSLVMNSRRSLFVLDQVNRRIQRIDGGHVSATLALNSAAVQDVAITPGGRVVALDRLGAHELTVFQTDGTAAASVPLIGRGITEGGAVTGVFADNAGIYVEREHQAMIRVADSLGNADPDRGEVPGRPSRGEAFWLTAAITDRAHGGVVVRAFDRTTHASMWERAIEFPDALLHLAMLDSDRRDRVYVAGVTGHESPAAPFNTIGVQWLVARIDRHGVPDGWLSLTVPDTADETFRSLAVGDDGSIYQLVPGPDGLDIVRYTFA